MYDIFDKNINLIQDIILCFIGGYFGLMGLVISGLAIIVSLFNLDELIVIDQLSSKAEDDSKKNITRTEKNTEIDKHNNLKYLNNFYYSIAQLAYLIVFNFFIILLINSKFNLINKGLFYFCTFLYIYLVVYNLFYVVSLSKACLQLFDLKKKCGMIALLSKKNN